jgi:hypothetical protein
MRSRPLFEMSIVKHTSQLFICITGLGSQAAYIYAFRIIFTAPFCVFKEIAAWDRCLLCMLVYSISHIIYIIFYNDMSNWNLLSGKKYIWYLLIYWILQYVSEIEIESNVYATALDCLLFLLNHLGEHLLPFFFTHTVIFLNTDIVNKKF